MRILVILAALVVAGLVATSAQAGEKVTICHATGSDNNPFVEVEVSAQSIESGHNPHAVHVGDYIGECEVLTSSMWTVFTSAHNTRNTQDPVASSISQPPEPTPTPSVPVALPRSGGAPE